MGLWPLSSKSSSSKPEAPPAPAAAPAAAAAAAQPAAAADGGKPKKKICCACPDTKRIRDECIAMRGEEHPYCAALIAAHKECLRLEGFNV